MSEQLLLNPLDVNSFDMNSFASGRALNANGNLYNVCNFLRLKSTGFPPDVSRRDELIDEKCRCQVREPLYW
jgi:hypothetical protein